ncbi:putative AMP-activated protein kinase gamma regulatory subunit [Tripterygium wilfordii]|uniref:Putative AMP-activated protein kinase gamma regulatory subunit n=1 Tax=Tripterygium wilfordii TaxID=458696 RepID=A0A7J7CDH3_TRIWF|nr:SNF1-related protein kinase regulatory subunit gamma-1-like [Tripterygium wilfordii]KAF5732214.1 putative AMP-activated protein kinase gamma regulatory subunit [Tripterygium wilfordii]
MGSMQMEVKMGVKLQGSPRSQVPSPEAKLGMKVEDLWDIQEPQLTPSEKLNSCFENIPVSAFPPAPSDQVIEIRSDSSLAEAVKILTRNKILSAPVVDVDAPEDASWMDRYIGIVEFAGIVVWILQQSEPPSPRSPNSGSALAIAANGMTNAAGLLGLGPEDAAATSGNFFEALTASEFYKNTKVRDISGSFRWAPFLALQKSNSFLTMLLLLSNYKMKSVPVVDLGEGKIDNIVTQSAVIHMLAECVGLHWFESWGSKKLSEIGLPLMSPDHMVKVNEDEPVLQAFKLMRKKRVGGIPVVEREGKKAVGNISLRDVQFLLTAPEIYHDYRSITAKNFLMAVRSYLEKDGKATPMSSGMITCTKYHTLKEMILMLDSQKIHRAYVVDDEGNLEGVITLRDIISRLVHEPHGYFGDFFDGVLPLPQNSRV